MNIWNFSKPSPPPKSMAIGFILRDLSFNNSCIESYWFKEVSITTISPFLTFHKVGRYLTVLIQPMKCPKKQTTHQNKKKKKNNKKTHQKKTTKISELN